MSAKADQRHKEEAALRKQARTGEARAHRASLRIGVEQLAGLPYGWDGDDGLPIRPDARDFALEVLGDRSPVLIPAHTPAPGVALDPASGAVVLTFLGEKGRSLSLIIPCAGVIEVARAVGDHEFFRGKVVGSLLALEINRELAWL